MSQAFTRYGVFGLELEVADLGRSDDVPGSGHHVFSWHWRSLVLESDAIIE